MTLTRKRLSTLESLADEVLLREPVCPSSADDRLVPRARPIALRIVTRRCQAREVGSA